jgi:hypothetical protein
VLAATPRLLPFLAVEPTASRSRSWAYFAACYTHRRRFFLRVLHAPVLNSSPCRSATRSPVGHLRKATRSRSTPHRRPALQPRTRLNPSWSIHTGKAEARWPLHTWTVQLAGAVRQSAADLAVALHHAVDASIVKLLHAMTGTTPRAEALIPLPAGCDRQLEGVTNLRVKTALDPCPRKRGHAGLRQHKDHHRVDAQRQTLLQLRPLLPQTAEPPTQELRHSHGRRRTFDARPGRPRSIGCIHVLGQRTGLRMSERMDQEIIYMGSRMYPRFNGMTTTLRGGAGILSNIALRVRCSQVCQSPAHPSRCSKSTTPDTISRFTQRSGA